MVSGADFVFDSMTEFIKHCSHYSTAHIYVDCADAFHMLRIRVVRHPCMIIFSAGTVKKKLAALCYSVQQVSFVLHCCVKQELLGLNMEKLYNEKSYHVTLIHIVLLSKFIK